jgi:hypothetical protein
MSIDYAYYNEHDHYTAQWLRNLIKRNLIAPGYVDERDIQDVKVDDLQGFFQHHFFAGSNRRSFRSRLFSKDTASSQPRMWRSSRRTGLAATSVDPLVVVSRILL